MTPDKPFKTNELEWVLFILMNLIAPPVGLIVGLLLCGTYGFFGSIVLFYLLFRLWKHVGGYKDAKLIFSPGITFAGKKCGVK